MIAEILIFLSVVLITSLYYSYRNRVEYFKSFKKRGISGPEPSLFFGNFLEIKKYSNKNDIIDKWTAEYGDVFGYFLGKKRYIVISDLDMINSIFIKNSKIFYNRDEFEIDSKYLMDSIIALKNERWAKIRKILTPIFSYTKVQSGMFNKDMHDCIADFKKEIKKKIYEGDLVDLKGKNSVEINIHSLFQAFTLDIISRTSFGLKENVYEANNSYMKSTIEFFKIANNYVVQLALLIPLLRTFLSFISNYITSGRLLNTVVKILKEHINLFVKSFRTSPTTSTDSETKEDAKFKTEKAKVLTSLLKKLKDKSITENEFIGNILLILLAGFETTSNSLTTAAYVLAKHPDVQEKLRKEIKRDGMESKYLDMFLYESLRIYPPVTFFVTRKAEEDCVINGIHFLKDDIIEVPIWLIHHNETYWPEPYKFIPERFELEQKKHHHPAQFLAFGIGHKLCLGLNFANYEIKMLLINLLKEFKIERCKDTPDPLEFVVLSVINNPSKPVILKLTKIDDQ